MTGSQTISRSSSLWNVSVVLLVVSAALFIVSRSSADPDLWGHVRFGQDILSRGSLPRFDPYSYLTAGREWINHEILSEISFAVAFDLLGPLGLSLVRLTISLAILLLLYRHLCARGLTPTRAGMILLLAMPALTVGLATTRPHLFTYLFFGVTLLILEGSSRRHGRRLLWALPVLFAVWVNFHGGVLAGLGIVAIWVLVEIVSQALPGRLRGASLRTVSPLWPAVGAVSALATLANPYGWKLPTFLIRTGLVSRPEISEWQPLELASFLGAFYLVLAVLVALALYRSRRRRHPAAMAALGLAALTPFLAIRNLPLFAIAAIVLGAEHAASAWPASIATRRPEAATRAPELDARRRRRFTALSLAAAASFLGLTIAQARCIRVEPPSSSAGYPIGAVELLAKSGVAGNMAVFFNWGEFVIWHLGPRIQVSMDGRRETVYRDDVYEEYNDFSRGVGRWDALLDDRPTDLALVPKESFPMFNLMALEPGWTLIYEDSLSALFARDDLPELNRLRSVEVRDVPADACICFPGLTPNGQQFPDPRQPPD